MFGYETNQKQINKLERQISAIQRTIEGGLWGSGLEYDLKDARATIKALDADNDRLSKRITVLEEIVRESGLITDFDNDEVKIREDRTFSIYGPTIKNVPYQINKVKVV